MTKQTFRDFVGARFGGVLRAGSHTPDGVACVLEAASVYKGLDWTDDPDCVGMPDIRPLNDSAWSSEEVRTEAMLRLYDAFAGWDEWSEDRRRDVVSRIAISTVREIVSGLPGLPDDVRERCRSVSDLPAASDAALAASDAGRAASDAVWAVAGEAGADADEVLLKAVDLWVRAAQEEE